MIVPFGGNRVTFLLHSEMLTGEYADLLGVQALDQSLPEKQESTNRSTFLLVLFVSRFIPFSFLLMRLVLYLSQLFA